MTQTVKAAQTGKQNGVNRSARCTSVPIVSAAVKMKIGVAIRDKMAAANAMRRTMLALSISKYSRTLSDRWSLCTVNYSPIDVLSP